MAAEYTPQYRPLDSSRSPRFTGPRTFMRLPHVETVDGVDVAVFGIPTDDAVSNRSGARLGPAAIRDASVLLRPYNPELGVDISHTLSVVDYSDAPTVPGFHLETLDRIEGHLSGYLRPVSYRSRWVATTRSRSASFAPSLPSTVRLRSSILTPTATYGIEYYGARYFHGTVFRRAAEEGLIVPECSIQAGMRGSTYGKADDELPQSLGFDAIPWRDMHQLSPREFGDHVRARVRRASRVPDVRHRLRGSGVCARHWHARGRWSDERSGAQLSACIERNRLSGV